MEFVTRAVKKEDSVASYRHWRAKTEPYMVVEIMSKLSLPKRFLAVVIDDGKPFIVSRHRVRRAAIKSCERHSKKRK